MKHISLSILLIFGLGNTFGQINVNTDDLPRFFEAFDAVLTTHDSASQARFINELYVSKASEGLKEFMVTRGGNTEDWRKMILADQEKLSMLRPWILSVPDQEKIIRRKVKKFKKLYPDFEDGDVHFCIGINNSGGTIDYRSVYIGCEVTAKPKKNWAVQMVLHEFSHTQQYFWKSINELRADEGKVNEYLQTHQTLLANCISEGMCDFIAELVNGKDLAKLEPEGHTAFGLQNRELIWEDFKKDMFEPIEQTPGWLYSSREVNGTRKSDLGYFVGHQICKSYYQNTKNKKKALQYMLELDLTDKNVKQLLLDSGYLTFEDLNKFSVMR